MQPLISLSQLTKRYQDMCALNQCDLELQHGVTGLLGPNGAGKSTLIKVVLGLVKVTSGTGYVLGYKLGQQGRMIRSRVGYMPEDDCYIPGLTGIEVVQFASALSGLPIVEGLRRSHEILDFCGMKQERYRKIETYSTGMRQKIKFAAAIVHDPEFLILDEPTSGLDPEERENLLNRIRILADEANKSVLISTHILPDVQAICDRAVIIAKGKLVLNEDLSSLNRPSSPTVSVRVNRNRNEFINRLQRNYLEVKETSTGDLDVSSDDARMIDKIWSIANETKASIVSLQPSKNDLESVFINAVKESEVQENASS
ncbi:MAG: ABC transporter ATP-binding protein [Planctomycetota bacterium]